MQAIILAGGKGTRLRPFTTSIPKPLVPIDDLPILEVILKQLKSKGFSNTTLAVNHLAELLMAFFRDGKQLGLEIDYALENEPLGTAGPLRNIDNLEENFLVMNGDLLTTLDYRDLFNFHQENDNDVTIAVYRKEVKIDLGVLKTDGMDFIDYIEKPVYEFDVSMGIYVMNRSIVSFIPERQSFDIPSLVMALHQAGKKIQCYKKDYYWLDIGRVEDYDTAVEIFKERRKEFLPDD